MTITAQQRARIAETLIEIQKADLRDQVRSVLAEVPQATTDDIVQVMETIAEELEMEAADCRARGNAMGTVAALLGRACELAGREMGTGEAVTFLTAAGGTEAETLLEALLEALNDPFLKMPDVLGH